MVVPAFALASICFLATSSMVIGQNSGAKAVVPSWQCGAGTFQCQPGFCIPKQYVCDTDLDCPHGEDETVSMCGEQKCKWNQFQCVTSHKCIPSYFLCDQYPDCPDASDERQNCTTTCSPDTFQCGTQRTITTQVGGIVLNNKCIEKSWVCDGENDCHDGSDEVNCPPRQCTANEFRCNNSHCVQKSFLCDHEDDCGDGSDETPDKCVSKTCAPQFQCGSGKCIPMLFRCDGQADCPSGVDEQGCATGAPSFPQTCNTDEFKCADGPCINKRWRCDGMPDCAGGSDEQGCQNIVCDPVAEWRCATGQCIHKQERCNNRSDCNDGSDEQNCDRTTFAPIVMPVTQAVVIHNCNISGTCSQICEQNGWRYSCKCFHGFQLQADAKSCKAMGADPELLLGLKNTVRQVDMQTMEEKVFIANAQSIYSMDYVYTDRVVYYGDQATNTITGCTFGLNGGQLVSACVPFLKDQGVDAIAVDWIHRLMYFTDVKTRSVNVVTLGTKLVKTLFTQNVDEPRAVAVDPQNGLIFWADSGETPRIEAAGMDGTQRNVIVTDNVDKPSAITLDIYAKKIYWTDAKLDALFVANYDGSQHYILRNDMATLDQPFSLTMFEDNLFWTDVRAPGIHSINKFTGDTYANALPHIQGPTQLKVLQAVMQPNFANKCAFHTCAIDQLCLPIAMHYKAAKPYVCVCPDKGQNLTFAKGSVCSSGLSKAERDGLIFGLMLAIITLLLTVSVVGWLCLRKKIALKSQFAPKSFENPVHYEANMTNVRVISDDDHMYHKTQDLHPSTAVY